MSTAPRPPGEADILYEIEIEPGDVILGAEPVKVDFHVLVTGPGRVAGELVPPSARPVRLEFGTHDTHPDWHARHVFRPDDPVGVWLLRLDVGGSRVETELEVTWATLRVPVRVGDFDVRPREIEEGEPVTAWGRLERETSRDERGRWIPFPGQLVLLGFRADESGERVRLGRAVTDADGVFTIEAYPWESGVLYPEPRIVTEPDEAEEAVGLRLPDGPDGVRVTVRRAAGSAKVKIHRIKRRGGAQYRHHVFVTVNSLPASRNKVQIYYKKSQTGTPGRVGETGGNVDGWFTVDTARKQGGLWQAVYTGPPSARGKWIKGG